MAYDYDTYSEAGADAKFVASADTRTLVVLTAAEYAALDPKVATTLYVIVG